MLKSPQQQPSQQQQSQQTQPQQTPQPLPHNLLSTWPANKGPSMQAPIGSSPQSQIDAILSQQKSLREQILQSEQNLTAQEGVSINQLN